MHPILAYPNPNLHCLVQANTAAGSIVIRTFTVCAPQATVSQGNIRVLPAADVAAALAVPVRPLAVTRATPQAAWLRLSDLPGIHATTALPADALVCEVAQTALTMDPDILGSGACSEHAEWVVFADSGGRLHAPVNRTLKTYPARSSKAAIYGEMQRNSVLTVLMPFRDTDFTRAAIYVKANPAYGIVYDAAAAYAVEANGMRVGGIPPRPADQKPFRWPELRLAVPPQLQADAFADIAVQLVDGTTGLPLTETGPQVYLESHAGYLPKRRLALVDGVATARIGALGLSPGDRLQLKAGWRYYPGLAEAEIVIV